MTTLTRSLTDADLREMTATRRDLHAHPETAFEEVRTASLVAARLREIGLEPRTGVGRTGVTALLEGGRPGRTVLLRADMDALPIQEENEVPYRSRHDGRMHACGHDCHTAILLQLAKHLAAQRRELPGRIVLCFQPAEETGGGADAMIADGVLESPTVDAAFGLHVWQDLDLGQVLVTPGPFMAAVDEFHVTVTGRGAHAAQPHLGRDPVLAMAHVVTALQSIASRATDPLAAVVVSVTRFDAGSAFNVIPETARINGTCRSFDPAVWKALPAQFETVVRGVAEAFGCRAEVRYERHNRATVNDPAMTRVVREAAVEVVGEDAIVDGGRTMGGEDFSAFLERVPGCFVAIGSRNAAKGLTHGHHHPRFDVDEGCLEIGAEVLLRTVRRALGS